MHGIQRMKLEAKEYCMSAQRQTFSKANKPIIYYIQVRCLSLRGSFITQLFPHSILPISPVWICTCPADTRPAAAVRSNERLCSEDTGC